MTKQTECDDKKLLDVVNPERFKVFCKNEQKKFLVFIRLDQLLNAIQLLKFVPFYCIKSMPITAYWRLT